MIIFRKILNSWLARLPKGQVPIDTEDRVSAYMQLLADIEEANRENYSKEQYPDLTDEQIQQKLKDESETTAFNNEREIIKNSYWKDSDNSEGWRDYCVRDFSLALGLYNPTKQGKVESTGLPIKERIEKEIEKRAPVEKEYVRQGEEFDRSTIRNPAPPPTLDPEIMNIFNLDPKQFGVKNE